MIIDCNHFYRCSRNICALNYRHKVNVLMLLVYIGKQFYKLNIDINLISPKENMQSFPVVGIVDFS